MGTKKVMIPRTTTGYGYAGTWGDGSVGWFLTDHVTGGGRKYAGSPPERAQEFVTERTERFYLCKITLTPVKDKKGRPVTKIVRPKAKKA